jgi:hypothetical protein
MQRLYAVNSLRQDRQAATAAAQRGVIGMTMSILSTSAIGWSKPRSVAEAGGILGGTRGSSRWRSPSRSVGHLLSSGRCLPCRDRLFGSPRCQASALDQCGVVF